MSVFGKRSQSRPAIKTQYLIILCVIWAPLISSAVGQSGNCTQKDGSTRPDCPQAIAFFRTFQSALRNNDQSKVASLVSYPVLISLHHKRTRIPNRAQLQAHFNEIFDNAVQCAILSATDKDVWGNSHGFTVDGGAIWFDGIIPTGENPDIKSPDYWTRYPFKVITINNDSHYDCQRAPGGWSVGRAFGVRRIR